MCVCPKCLSVYSSLNSKPLLTENSGMKYISNQTPNNITVLKEKRLYGSKISASTTTTSTDCFHAVPKWSCDTFKD